LRSLELVSVFTNTCKHSMKLFQSSSVDVLPLGCTLNRFHLVKEQLRIASQKLRISETEVGGPE